MADQPLPRALFPNRSSILHRPGATSRRCWVRGRMRGGKGGGEEGYVMQFNFFFSDLLEALFGDDACYASQL